ncbi:hypothetical protein G9A89_000877 [Geosiphon pyriformis]|nr:hypothetical protein G9A89_000877 [Geosiphon pyriformis]
MAIDEIATVGPSIAVIKKIVKEFRAGDGFKSVLSRKKKKDVVLEESAISKEVPTIVPSGRS